MFDPYHKWLAIPKQFRPPTFYQLLGLGDGESDPEVIEEAAIRQTAHLRTYQTGPHAELCTRLLNELAEAKTTLLNPAKRRAYDAELARKKAHAEASEGPVRQRGKGQMGRKEFRFDDDGAGIVQSSPRQLDVRKPAPKLSATHWTLIGAGAAIVVVTVVLILVVFTQQSTPQRERIEPVFAKKKIEKAKEPIQPPIVAKKNPVIKPPVVNRPPIKPKKKNEPQPKQKQIPVNVAPKVDGDLQRFEVKMRPEFMAISPDGKTLVAGFHRLLSYDLQTGRELAVFQALGRIRTIKPAVCFLPDGKRVLYAYTAEPDVVIGDVQTGQALARMPESNVQYVACIAAAPDGKRALAGYNYRFVYWDLKTKERLRTAKTKYLPLFVAMDPIGRNAVAVHHGTIRNRGPSLSYLDLDDLSQTGQILIADNGRVHSMAMSSTGELVAVGTSTKLALIELPKLTLHKFTVPDPANHLAVAFCRKGRVLLGGGKDGVIRVWDIDKGQQLDSWRGHTAPITQIVVAANESVAVSGDKNGMVHVWPLDKIGKMQKAD